MPQSEITYVFISNELPSVLLQSTANESLAGFPNLGADPMK